MLNGIQNMSKVCPDCNIIRYRLFPEDVIDDETERLKNLLYILQNESRDVVNAKKDRQVVRTLNVMKTLNNRENLVPVFIAYMGSLMGFFIVMAYIFYDKAEGVIKAFAAAPSASRSPLPVHFCS